MNRLDTESMLVGLRNARHETILAWSPEPESEAAVHLLNALLDVELAITALENANGSGVRPTAGRTDDDEPSTANETHTTGDDDEPASDGIEADGSIDIRGMVSALASKARPR